MQIPNVDDGIMTPSESQHRMALAGTKKSTTTSTKQNKGSASSTISRPSATQTSQQIIQSPTTTQQNTTSPPTSATTTNTPPNTSTSTTSHPQPPPRSSPRGAGNHSPSGRMRFDWDDYLEGIRPRGSSTPAHSNNENDAANHGRLTHFDLKLKIDFYL